MTTRSSAAAMAAAADADARAVLRSVGLTVASPPTHGSADLVIAAPDGEPVPIEVKTAAIPSLGWIEGLRTRSARAVLLVVGDQISADLRSELNGRGIAWLDRRGHVRVTAPGIFVDAEVAPRPRAGAGAQTPPRPISGRAGLAAAASLLMGVDAPANASDTARAARLAPSSITRALHMLVDAHLVERKPDGTYRPLVPELFWALADVWPRATTALYSNLDTVLGRVSRNLSGPALGGERGAVAWGAPLVLTADYPPIVYLPDEAAVRAAQASSGRGSETVRVKIDVTGLVTRRYYRRTRENLPLAHPLFCALDLTATARDREVLEQWLVPPEFTRVW